MTIFLHSLVGERLCRKIAALLDKPTAKPAAIIHRWMWNGKLCPIGMIPAPSALVEMLAGHPGDLPETPSRKALQRINTSRNSILSLLLTQLLPEEAALRIYKWELHIWWIKSFMCYETTPLMSGITT